jgi:3-hydroxyacyl-CoA dehydrogenase
MIWVTWLAVTGSSKPWWKNLQVKQDLYRKIQQHRAAHTVISSNTSTLPLADLCRGMDDDFTSHFLVTHFFNPPRYMRLLEIVTSEACLPAVEQRIRHFCDHYLGKTVVDCKDTPGFIANRIGTFWLQTAVVKAMAQNISVETADAVLSRPAGVPKTGVFGLLDLVGLDLMPHILASLSEHLPSGDAFHQLGTTPPLLEKMVASGYTGRKGQGGFYRLDESGEKQVICLQTGEYSRALRPKPAALAVSKKHGLRALLEHDSPEGRYAWSVLSDTLVYAASLVPEITLDIKSVDTAMRLGYNWQYGPFELLDQIGTQWFVERLRQQQRPVPPLLSQAADKSFYRVSQNALQYLGTDQVYHALRRAPGVILLEDVKRRQQPLLQNRSAAVWDIGEGVACFEFRSKMNSLNPFIMNLLKKALRELPSQGFKGMVIYNEAEHFSVGANIAMLMIGARLRLWPFIRWVLQDGQQTFNAMQHGNFPVVGAPAGMAVGGGCEILLHCHAIVAHAETYMGLVEVGVGIVPGWGGCKEMLRRWRDAPKAAKGPMAASMKAFEMIAQAQVATSAEEAKEKQLLRTDDDIVMNRDRILATAREKVLSLAADFKPPAQAVFRLAGPAGKAALSLGIEDYRKKGVATAHDACIAGELATVLTGADTDLTEELTEEDILRLEREAIIRLAKTPESLARVTHMLKEGKPLRN